MGEQLDDRRRALLTALETLGPGWHSRTDLARALGKKGKRLNVAEITLLDIMAESGQVQRQTMQPAPGSSAYVYRLK